MSGGGRRSILYDRAVERETRRDVPWRVTLPDGAAEVAVPAPPECTRMAHLRGEIAPACPFFGVLSTSERHRQSAWERARDLGAGFVEPAEPARASVAGARRAARVDGRIDMEEGLTADGIERISVVVAETAREFVVLTVRTRPEDPVEGAVEAILGSFRVEVSDD
jgi:hypothetical protein